MSEEIAHALEDAAKKAEQGLSKDFSDAYHGILKDTEDKTGQVADNAATDAQRRSWRAGSSSGRTALARGGQHSG